MESHLKTLISDRGLVKASLTRFKRFYAESGQTCPINSLQKRLDTNSDLIHSFNRIQEKIELLVVGTESEAVHAAEREGFENTYFDLTAEIEEYIKGSQPAGARELSASPTNVSVISSPRVDVQLPVIQLPSFDGNYNDWIRFRDTFVALVHDNSALSDIQRFHYLNSALKGPAARVVKSLGISGNNYKVAWDTLKARYEDPMALRRHHMGALLNLSPIQRQSQEILQEFVDDTNNHILALQALGEPVESWDFIIVSLLSRKLDMITLREWEKRVSHSSERETYKGFTQFLEERSRYLGSVTKTQVVSERVDRRPQPFNGSRFGRVTTHVASARPRCPICHEEHALYQCRKFKDLDLQGRREMVQMHNRCYNCLGTGHGVLNCSRKGCYLCSKKHHSLLHRQPAQSNKTTVVESQTSNSRASSEQESPTCVANIASGVTEYTVLSTALIDVEDTNGKKWECRVLLDSGSQANFITKDFCNRLGIVGANIKTQVAGLGRATNTIREQADLQIASRHNSFRANVACLIIENITTDMANIPLQRTQIPIPSNIHTADPRFDECRRIDMLIGAGLFWRLLCIGQHKAGSGLLWQKTQLGWVLGGQLTWPINNSDAVRRCHVATENDLHKQLEYFWRIEEPFGDELWTGDECEKYFQNTTRRDDTGRYVVRIPFRDNVSDLGTTREQAERRLRALERRLERHPELRTEYAKFMEEYETLGHMSKISEPITEIGSSFYLPHHAVTKATSSTTKVRVVFDGSAKSSSGVSLNDVQLVGPMVQSDLFSILIRFRCHKYVLSADIAKMYRQVLIEPKDRKFQRILWRANSESPIQAYELNTVTYGTASAPFLATRVLRQVGLECAPTNPETSRIIMNDFYVDDLLTGAETIAEAVQRRRDISDILRGAGFSLRKWASNCPAVLNGTPTTDANETIIANKDPKTLGLLWSSVEDQLLFAANSVTQSRITKRIILSEIARIFDPLGLVGPLIARAKIVLQQLWQLKLGWDESVPQELHTQWSQFRKEIGQIATIKIPRRVLADQATCIELHGFADASERAYGACIYVRTLSSSGSWDTRLLCAKSRVAPLKAISLPRLELCGALLLAQLLNKVKTAFNFTSIKEQYWSDSTITLAWIKSQSSRWKTFVANRVAEIQRLSNVDHWTHVASEHNPADLLSRGTSPASLADNAFWWSGPVWLGQDSTQWPVERGTITEIPEEKGVKITMTLTTGQNANLIKHFSNFTRLVRVVSYCLRFVDIARKKRTVSESASYAKGTILTTSELRVAEERVIRLTQEEIFSKELTALKGQQAISKSSPLLCLNPFLDTKGLLRVGGRLSNSELHYNAKHPIILPSNHHLTDLIIKHEHIRLLHAGSQLVSASLRGKYWILSCRRNIKRILHKCVRCFRVRPRTSEYIMGDLPAARVRPARPFATCGIDYAGPFHTKDRTRSKTTIKSYLCLFVCFVTKAIHLEVATDLSSEAFLNCLKRFTARRGRSQCIVSDNGTNFIGARNELKDLGILIESDSHKRKVAEFLNNEHIEWRLNPPHAPHFGGLWESAVKAVKYHLRRIIGEQRLTFEELYTLITQVESCLNSRPLTPISSDPSDLNPLTPGHFLIGGALNSLADHDLRDINSHRLGRYQLIQQMFQHFWQRWHREYLHQLQQRNKWRTSGTASWALDTMVVVKDDNLPPLRWRLGRIVKLHQGADSKVRVVTVRTADGIIKRPVSKLCILPIEDDLDHTPSKEKSG